jgi:GT2 family glycosyltransferase
MARCSIIVPVYNQSALTARCLRRLVELDACELLVVDDASTDDTLETLAEFGGRVRVVRHRVNKGFAASCNDGAKTAKGKFLVFLNNDTVPQTGWLEALLEHARAHPRAAVVGGKLLYPNGAVQHAGVVICQDRYPRHVYTGFPADHPAVCKSRRFQIVTAACMLVRRGVFEREGGFDTAFRNGFEDVDFCLRLGERGHEVHYCARSVVQHLESVSPGRFRRDRQNVALYRKRWLDRVRPDDVAYYLEDGLLRLTYEGQFPFNVEISPLLATIDGDGRLSQLERLLRARTREKAELQRENTRLSLELAGRAAESPELCYRHLREQVVGTIRHVVPSGSTVAVISKGDSGLLEVPGRQAWHFPQTDRGVYAGHHPADSEEAVRQLEKLREKGAEYLVIPQTSLWWLEHYAGFREHLEVQHQKIEMVGGVCAIYSLHPPGRFPAKRDGRKPTREIRLARPRTRVSTPSPPLQEQS